MPNISIITPAYADIPEKAQWLDEAIQSVLVQSFQDWEMIIIDDQSLYDLSNVEAKYANDPRVRWVKSAMNSGPAKVRNTAVAMAVSDCILPLDADDLLAGPNVLENMYRLWVIDKTKIIYGNLTQYLPSGDGKYHTATTFNLGSYTFELAMNLGGVMPITAMHSKACHYAAGGWKPELEAGLEDVEYWLAAGKAGFCGQKINQVTLLYRRQEESRAYKLKHINQRHEEMKRMIEEMHADVYLAAKGQGKFPMGCCDNKNNGGGDGGAVAVTQVNVSQARITKLEGFDEKDLTWIRYIGPKKGTFSILSRGDRPDYRILGTGHTFQARKEDAEFFRVQGRGTEYAVNIPEPNLAPKVEVEKEASQEYGEKFVASEPVLATIERLDRVASQNVEPTIVKEEISITSDQSIMADVQKSIAQIEYTLDDLGTGSDILAKDDWTVEKVAEATINDLTKYKGIGPIRANDLISAAKNLIANN